MTKRIIVPRGPIVKRILLEVDNSGNIQIKAENIAPPIADSSGLPMMAMPPIEVLFWLSKGVADGLYQSIKNSSEIGGGLSDGPKTKTD